ncbi:nuclear transport factor 2 family protein [Sporichthya brevicatena]|uniref:nuclear transport factor 2 family protein n=1 Tax=Sporichthya brevicatena TaxID=171442 RepID=UPI0031DD7798
MTSVDTLEQNIAIVREYFSALNDRDLDRAVRCWVPSGGVEAVPGNRGLPVPVGLRGFFGSLFDAMGEWKLEVLETTAQDDRVCVHWRAQAAFTGPGRFDGFLPTGAGGEVQGLDQLTVRDGLIVRNDAYFDAMELGRAIGLMPPAGSPPDKGMKGMVNLQTRVKGLLAKRKK